MTETKTKILISNVGLKRLLQLTQRPQFVNGKVVNQVDSCLLYHKGSNVYTQSLVRDGRTSLSKFTLDVGKEVPKPLKMPICDINRVLGVLVYHGTNLELTYSNDRLKIKSQTKQTTLIGSENAKAFPHSNETINSWADKSVELGNKIIIEYRKSAADYVAEYKLAGGSIKRPSFQCTAESNDMFEALRCNNMNGQKLNRYTFSRVAPKRLDISVGDELLGKTKTGVAMIPHLDGKASNSTQGLFDIEFEGGLENVFKHFEGKVTLYFFDFREQKQGYRLVIRLDDTGKNYVYQASVI